MQKHKTRAWQLGWQSVVIKLLELHYALNQQIYVERIHYNTQYFLMYATGEEKEYAEGILAAVELFDKTGHVPSIT